MRKKFLAVFYAVLCLCIICSVSDVLAAHPLITDDAGTMGKGNSQFEVNSEFGVDRERVEGIKVKESIVEVAAILTYGITDNIDFVLGLPYQWTRVKEDGKVISKSDGISDLSLELKWRFYERDGISLALKPGVSLPTGDEDKGLGQGRATYSLFFITTKELGASALHLNIGYIRNENKHDERKDIYHASLAGEVEVLKGLKVVANVGVERNPDKASNIHPAFVIGGMVYSVTDNFDIDIGIKGGLNKPETDITTMAGITLRF